MFIPNCPARSIVVLAEDFNEEDLVSSGIQKTFADFLYTKTVAKREDTLRYWEVYPRLKTLIVPGSAAELLAKGLLGHLGVIAIGDERMSFAPPGLEPGLPKIPWWHSWCGHEPLDATGVLQSRYTGKGELVMVLDVGFYGNHPDFQPRRPPITVHSFTGVKEETAHGTRSVGLACGPAKPSNGKRYGVAYDSAVFVGLVESGCGIPDCALLAGVEEAIKLQAAVVNFSGGGTIDFNEPYNLAFEEVAQRALHEGVLIVAAAGNDQSNEQHPVNHPANCPSVLSVGGLDENFRPHPESCIRANCDGEVDIAAPAAAIRSATIPGEGYYNLKSGTSSAAAIVSGIAALWAEKGYYGCDLWHALVDHAGRVKDGSRKTSGAGIVKAPR